MNLKIFISIGFCLLSLFFACKQKATEPQSTSGFANDTDYICNMKVQANFTDTCHYQGKVYAFCSSSCKDEFKANPVSFLNKEAKQ